MDIDENDDQKIQKYSSNRKSGLDCRGQRAIRQRGVQPTGRLDLPPAITTRSLLTFFSCRRRVIGQQFDVSRQ